MHLFEIAGVLIEIETDTFNILNRLKAFKAYSKEAPNLKISISACGNMDEPDSKIVLDEGFKWFQGRTKKVTDIYKCKKDSDEVIAMLRVDSRWSSASIFYIGDDQDGEFTATESFCEILFRNAILFHQGIVMHASAIAWEGKGIAFSAQSGTGKSTQAALWKRLKGAKILNDDRPAIRVVDGHASLYGTPWSGSSTEHINCNIPLSMIVVLEQAIENTVHRLTSEEALPYLIPRCFLPYHDDELMEKALNNFEKIIEKVPIYLLKCTPDRDAVEMVIKCLK